jgi:hypothetical protein
VFGRFQDARFRTAHSKTSSLSTRDGPWLNQGTRGEKVTAEGGRDGKDAAFAAVDGGLATFDLTVLPMDATEDRLFIYDEAAIDLVKELRAAGVDAGYAHQSDVRRYYSERSAEIAVSLLINLGSSAI